MTRLLINGSFVTSRSEPNDVDCVLLQASNVHADRVAMAELRRGLPFLEIKVVNDDDYRFFADDFFGTDRDMIAKGVVEVVL